MSTTVQYMDVHDQVIYTPYGWCAFPQLDHFNTDLLLEVLLSKDGNGQPAIWKTAEIPVTENGSYCLSTVALMQLEALFNLSQVMFALYNGNIKQATFRDIQLRHASRDIRTAGFRKLGSGGSNMREALHSVAWDIVEAGALPVIFSMYKNPVLPIVKQKTLDTLTNVLNVEKISKHILREDGWFLRETVSLINGGDLSSEKTPAASCISRMIAAILCLRLKKEFNTLVELKYADVVLSVLEDKTLSEDRTKEFCKFETITLQSISMLLQDGQYVSCNQEIRYSLSFDVCIHQQNHFRTLCSRRGIHNQLYSYAYECIMQWQIEDSQPGLTIDSSEGNTDAGFATGGLVFSLIILVHITKSRMEKKHLLASDTKFEHQLLFLWDAYGPQSSLGRINTGVMNAIADLHSGLFDQAFLSDKKNSGLALPSLSILRNKVKRHCSNHQCQKVETKVQEFKVCSGCHLVCYCSVACQRSDWKRGGHKRNCKLLKIGVRQPRNDRMSENIENESQDVKQLSTLSCENEITVKMYGKSHKGNILLLYRQH
ncbi:uncharacterized protein [Ptychodera flava]|uniref:uncharacterized protein n=1 Tax=Ptychodera flava TaxID=63121 RepID=UPI003969E10B